VSVENLVYPTASNLSSPAELPRWPRASPSLLARQVE
jgi:hypothetical protein